MSAVAALAAAALSAAGPGGQGVQTGWVEVDGVRIAYAEAGSGDPIVFVHGNPTSSYLWRNVVPFMSDRGRTIALDLPGMGASDKPRPAPGFVEQVRLFEGFVDALGLDRVTLVGHDWGAAIAFEYARLHRDRVRGIAFMEGVLPPIFPQPSFEAIGEEMGGMFRAFKDPVQGNELVIEQNMFVEQVLPGFVQRPLSEEDMEAYRRPFLDPADRGAVLEWPRQVPIAGEPAEVVERMELIRAFLTETRMPVLLLYAAPGVLVPPALVPWYEEQVHDLEAAFVGAGLHFIQEDQPEAIGRAVRDWMRRRIE